jgi:hypothetical protein
MRLDVIVSMKTVDPGSCSSMRWHGSGTFAGKAFLATWCWLGGRWDSRSVVVGAGDTKLASGKLADQVMRLQNDCFKPGTYV